METQPAMESPAVMAPESADDQALLTADETADEPTPQIEAPGSNPPDLEARIEALEKRLVQTDELIRQARHQGYIDGRNESIESLTSQPALWQQPDGGGAIPDDEPQIMILDNVKPSIWS